MRHTLLNFTLTLMSLYTALRCGVAGWRYPLTTHLNKGFRFPIAGSIIETLCYNRLKFSSFHQVLARLNTNVMLVAHVQEDHLLVYAYRLIANHGQTDLTRAVNATPGNNGRFHYVYHDGKLLHALRSHSVLRQKGFYADDPVFCFEVPLEARDMAEVLMYVSYEDPEINGLVRHVRDEGLYRNVSVCYRDRELRRYSMPSASM